MYLSNINTSYSRYRRSKARKNEKLNFGEKWIIHNQRNEFYQALYHDKKYPLNFQPADLKTLGKQSSWEMRITLFPKGMLLQLQQKKQQKISTVWDYSLPGIDCRHQHQVDWIPELKLPFSVKKRPLTK